MSDRRRILIASMVAIAALSGAALAVADEEHFYESLPDVSIGKVFFTPVQRAQLDRRRGSAPVLANRGTAAPARNQEAVKNDAAGFIISSNGTSKIYTNGDFVKAREIAGVKFPGSVTIVRSQESDEVESSDEDD